MELWIRSQDRESIIKVEKLELISDFLCGDEPQLIHIDSDKGRIGSYSTEERALEVLDEIQNKINNYASELYACKNIYVGDISYHTYIYEMPQE